jgi:2-(1,2-epoxy-1,2-dihydrophenyl)acetyl-CoA isomerase
MPDIIETIRDGVAILTLNRPEARNALSPEMLGGLNEALPRLHADASVGAIILTGAGGAFCSGGDVKGFASRPGGANAGGSVEDAATNLRQRMECSRLLHQGQKITIAAIPGAAAGAGLSLALACDFRIAAKGAKLTTAFVKVGLAGDFGGTYYLTQLLGAAKARELYLLSDVITAEEGEKLGMINRVVEPGDLQAEAFALAQRFAKGPTLTLGLIKRSLNVAEKGDLALSFETEAMNHSRAAATEDHKEAAKAFVEKRAPVFHGRSGLAGAAGLSAIALLVAACAATPEPTVLRAGDAAEGQKVAQSLCSSCHAVGASDDSPNAKAPPLRNVLSTYPPATLVRDLRNAVAISHRNMPTFHFGEGHADDLVAYLVTIQDPEGTR